MVDLFFYRDPEEVRLHVSPQKWFNLFAFQTEKEEQTGPVGQDQDAQAHGIDSNYYDEGPSMMPASETFAGNQDNWGASAEGWGAPAAGTTNTNEWSAAAPATTGTVTNWWSAKTR